MIRIGNHNGNVMIIALFAVGTFITIGSFFLSSVTFDIKNASWERDKVQAIYLAEAGLNRAIKALREDPDWSDDRGATKNITPDGWYYLFDGEDVVDVPLIVGKYTVMLNNVSSSEMEVRSIGEAGSQKHTIQVRLRTGTDSSQLSQLAEEGAVEAMNSLWEDTDWSDNAGATSNIDDQDKHQGDWYPLYDEDVGGDVIDVPVEEGGQTIGSYSVMIKNLTDDQGNVDENAIDARSLGESESQWCEQKMKFIKTGGDITGEISEIEERIRAISSAMVGLSEASESLWEDTDWSDNAGATSNIDDQDKHQGDWYPLYDEDVGGDVIDVPVEEGGQTIGSYSVMIKNLTDDQGNVETDEIMVELIGQSGTQTYTTYMRMNRNDMLAVDEDVTRIVWEKLIDAIETMEEDMDWSDNAGATSNIDDQDKHQGDWYPLYDEDVGGDVIDVPVEEGGQTIGSYSVMIKNLTDDQGNIDENAVEIKLIGSSSESHRQIIRLRLEREADLRFRWALFGKERVKLTGSVETNSYNSNLGGYWSQSHGENGHVGSNGNIRITGSAEIHGDARPGPGHTTTITGSATVTGSTEPLPEPVVLPDLDPFQVGDQDLRKTGSTQITFTEGTYYYEDMRFTGSSKLIVEGAVTIYCKSFTQTGSAQLIIKPGSSLTMYCKESFKLAGSGLINQTGVPSNFRLFSTARKEDNDEIRLTGGSEFCGVVYAPYTDADVTGSHQFYGSVVVGGEVHGTGSTEYHYDEALADEGLTVRNITFILFEKEIQEVSWQEVM